MFCLDSFLTNWLDFTKTIIPLALVASESIAHETSWANDSESIRAQKIIVNYSQIGQQTKPTFPNNMMT